MSLGDDIREEAQSTLQGELARVRRQRDSAVLNAAKLTAELDTLRRSLDVVDSIEAATMDPPKWLSPAVPKASSGTLVAMLSDTHFDEVVNPEEVDHLNAYNREIALMRLERWCGNVVKMARHYFAGVTYDGMVLILGGDIFSGDIHEELSETNADTILGSLLYWSEQLAAAIDLLQPEFKKVHVASVVGNHGRTTRKPRAKLRVRTNYDWLLAKMLERHFRGNKAVTFDIPESADVLIHIYEHGHLITHGDQVNGGGGIGGIYPPIMRLRARKQQRHMQTGSQWTTLWMGHWHQYLSTPTLVVNGSLKGWDEYAAVSNFGFEPPQQALAIVAPEKNITVHAPVFCLDRKKEGW